MIPPTILCVGVNLAWDVTYHVPRLVPGDSHRVLSVRRRAGGKAANVARVLRGLGGVGHLLGPAGPQSAPGYAADLSAADVTCTLTSASDPLRTSVTVVDADGATVLNEPGAPLSGSGWRDLLDAVARHLPAPVVVLSGSLPPGAPPDAYRQLTEMVRSAGSTVLLDAGGPALTAAIAACPDIVKPNIAELSQHAGRPISDISDVLRVGAELLDAGIRTVIVSAGRGSLVALTEQAAYRVRPPLQEAGNPTGAGDALAAALAYGVSHQRPWPDIIRRAVAVAAAAASLPEAGDTDVALAQRLASQVRIEELAWAG